MILPVRLNLNESLLVVGYQFPFRFGRLALWDDVRIGDMDTRGDCAVTLVEPLESSTYQDGKTPWIPVKSIVKLQ